jgi:hypothetical protein
VDFVPFTILNLWFSLVRKLVRIHERINKWIIISLLSSLCESLKNYLLVYNFLYLKEVLILKSNSKNFILHLPGRFYITYSQIKFLPLKNMYSKRCILLNKELWNVYSILLWTFLLANCRILFFLKHTVLDLSLIVSSGEECKENRGIYKRKYATFFHPSG